MKTYNKEEIDKLFDKNSILVDCNNVVPINRAILLFGTEAVKYAKQVGPNCNGYGLGENEPATIFYFHKKGFYKAATYYNIRIVQDEEKNS